ncbi:hypothetical protein PAERUG_P58_London_29_09_13_03485 [Pseudomonas aeruginosa]|nr:Uncharacterised protein [Pseudomonas aeruginosa]SST09258.1 Uncharacterised protein [Acinetobacter baumannii]SVJ79180.1 Uncharacterised protein [Klebsiella pneumoniae]CRN42294.1 hypothetical protein PAERUG_E12_London_26_VIM_2_06_13_00023 [Pseudomonas aeruginosa]CRN93818.1 hypothetical protein PAERUG_P14_London_17_VIM_2_01_10_00395 [Pseudomonas aeruginosa]
MVFSVVPLASPLRVAKTSQSRAIKVPTVRAVMYRLQKVVILCYS